MENRWVSESLGSTGTAIMCCGDAVMALRGFETIVGPSPSTGWLAGAIAPLAERNKRHLAGFTGV